LRLSSTQRSTPKSYTLSLHDALPISPAYCECCGVKNEDYTIYKNGTKTSRITLPISGVYTTYLNLKKQRFYCKACNGTFSASTSIVQKDCFISNHTKAKIL